MVCQCTQHVFEGCAVCACVREDVWCVICVFVLCGFVVLYFRVHLGAWCQLLAVPRDLCFFTVVPHVEPPNLNC
jgi:hypothetical protein